MARVGNHLGPLDPVYRQLFTGRAYSLRGDTLQPDQYSVPGSHPEAVTGSQPDAVRGDNQEAEQTQPDAVLSDQDDDMEGSDTVQAAIDIQSQPDEDTYITALELDDKLTELYKDTQGLIQVYMSWERVIIQHRYSKPASDGIAKEKAKVIDLQADIEANFGCVDALLRMDLDRFVERTHAAKSEYQTLKDQVKKFLPKDIVLAMQVKPLSNLVDETAPLAKRLRSV